MCGIVFSLQLRPCKTTGRTTADAAVESPGADGISGEDSTWDALVAAVQPRGPDAQATHTVTLSLDDDHELLLRFHASVLHMRGREVTRQPFVSPLEDILLFNGEIFEGLEIPEEANDGQTLFEHLQRARPEDLLSAIKDVEGPYAFVYLQAQSRRLWFGRDPLGRRSLLVSHGDGRSMSFTLSSVGPCDTSGEHRLKDVPCDAIYSLDLADLLENPSLTFQAHPRAYSVNVPDSLSYPFGRLDTRVPEDLELQPVSQELPTDGTGQTEAMNNLRLHLLQSLRKRVHPVPHNPDDPKAKIAVLFSGGVDCATIALLLDEVLPENEAIDLINVAFENPRVVNARSKGKGGAREPDREPRTDPVSNEHSHNDTKDPSPDVYEVPDRLTGRDTLAELRMLRPCRKWNFVEANVPYREVLEERDTVNALMSPNNTVMDLSISLAFYFAARGRGVVEDPATKSKKTFTSTARVLLSGLGADELLGGYARHRRAYYSTSSGGDWSALVSEMQLDLDRLPYRNLGRDDRIISHHGKEARYPFLAADVVDFCVKLPIWVKCDMRFREGVGEKMLLRTLARNLGLEGAAGLKKRAIHFGAKTAKMEMDSGKAKGDTVRSKRE